MSRFSLKKWKRRPSIRGVLVAESAEIGSANIVAEGKGMIGGGSKISGDLHIGFGSTVGYRASIFGEHVRIGRYCQLAPDVAIYAINHPLKHATTYLNSNLFDGRLKKNQRPGRVTIGNDVWLGHQVVVLPGVTIGDGAVVGASSVVTKDIEPYAICVGNPAREIRKRFPENIIRMLLQLRWWELNSQELLECEDFFYLDLELPLATVRLQQLVERFRP